MSCLQCFSSKEILIKHCEVYLKNNGKKATKMAKNVSDILVTNYHKHLQVLFVFYVEFEANLKEVEKINKESYTDKYQNYIASSHRHKLVWVDNKCSKFVQIYRGENAVYKLISKMLEKGEYCKEIMRNILKKN